MSRRATRLLLYAVLAVLVALHHDFWLWNDDRVILGMPVGLLYHVGYCGATAVLMLLLVRFAWPDGLEADEDQP